MCKRWGAAVGPHDNLALRCWPACQQVNSFAIALCVSAAFTTGGSVVSIAGLIVLYTLFIYREDSQCVRWILACVRVDMCL